MQQFGSDLVGVINQQQVITRLADGEVEIQIIGNHDRITFTDVEISDHIIAAGEQDAVGTGTTDQGVVAGTTIEAVVAVLASEVIMAALTAEMIRTASTTEPVMAPPAGEHILSGFATQGVLVLSAMHMVMARTTDQ